MLELVLELAPPHRVASGVRVMSVMSVCPPHASNVVRGAGMERACSWCAWGTSGGVGGVAAASMAEVIAPHGVGVLPLSVGVPFMRRMVLACLREGESPRPEILIVVFSFTALLSFPGGSMSGSGGLPLSCVEGPCGGGLTWLLACLSKIETKGDSCCRSGGFVGPKCEESAGKG